MSVHALPRAAPFAACLQLFRRYPLAVTQHCADGGYRSMVLHAAGPDGFFVLTQARNDLFVIRSWNRRDGVNQEIRPGEPVSGIIGQTVTGSMPVPHDGALLGWVTDSQVTALLTVHCRQPEPWGAPVPVPEIRVMPMAGPAHCCTGRRSQPALSMTGACGSTPSGGRSSTLSPSSLTALDAHSGCLHRTGEASGMRQGASLSRTTCRLTSTGCRPASTWITGRYARASSLRLPTAC